MATDSQRGYYELDGWKIWNAPGLTDADVRAIIQAERDRRAAEREAGLKAFAAATPERRRGAELLAEKFAEPIGRG